MRLEFHQLDRRWEHLRVRHPARQRRLLASLAEVGQQTPIIVVAVEGQVDRYVVIDGYKRLAALQQLGRDTVEAVVWPMSEVEALLLDRSRRWSEHETALEQGWLLAELEQRYGYGREELARRFDRSTSWVSRRLALVDLLPEAIQQQVREGKISAHVAMKFLVPGPVSAWRTASAWPPCSLGIAATRGKPGNCMQPGATPRPGSANVCSTNPSCSSKPSRQPNRRLPRQGPPPCCAIWTWRPRFCTAPSDDWGAWRPPPWTPTNAKPLAGRSNTSASN